MLPTLCPPGFVNTTDGRTRTDTVPRLRIQSESASVLSHMKVADLHPQAEIGQKINERYVQRVATIEETKSVAEVSQGLGQRTTGMLHRSAQITRHTGRT